MAIITLLKDWTSGQGNNLKPGDKIDIDRETYNALKSEGICESLNNDWDAKAPKKKTKKVETSKEI
tara:strand:+ start:830 stop:1027 length:198 start_codon:yes stop_codon:yes gene_type:complete